MHSAALTQCNSLSYCVPFLPSHGMPAVTCTSQGLAVSWKVFVYDVAENPIMPFLHGLVFGLLLSTTRGSGAFCVQTLSHVFNCIPSSLSGVCQVLQQKA